MRYRCFRYFSLSELLLFLNDDTICMWVDALAGKSARDVLREVIERMRHASEDEIQTRVWQRLYHVIETEPTLKHREWLKSRDLLEAAMAHDRAHWPERYEDLKTGRSQPGFLRDLERKYPNG